MKIVKWVVSLFNRLLNKQKPTPSNPVVHQELKTDPIVFIKGSPEKTVVVEQEETQPEDISNNIKVEEIEKPMESFVENITDDIKVEASDNLVEITKRFTELVTEIPVSEIKEVVDSLKPKSPTTKPDKKTKSETKPEEVKETKKKPTRRSKSKKKS
jgi:hypothetical protein